MFGRTFAVLSLVLGLAVGLAACRTVPDEAAPKTSEPTAHPGELGAACTPGGGVNGIDPCGVKERISVLFIPHTFGPSGNGMTVPCTLSKPVRPSEMVVGASAVSTCITEGTLYANADCFSCRLPGAGWNLVARLGELTTAQALAIQARLGLPGDAALGGEKAWRGALAPRAEAHAAL